MVNRSFADMRRTPLTRPRAGLFCAALWLPVTATTHHARIIKTYLFLSSVTNVGNHIRCAVARLHSGRCWRSPRTSNRGSGRWVRRRLASCNPAARQARLTAYSGPPSSGSSRSPQKCRRRCRPSGAVIHIFRNDVVAVITARLRLRACSIRPSSCSRRCRCS